MSQKILGILIGGIIPALFYGVSAITMKAGSEYKISTSSYLMIIGIAIFITGIVLKPFITTSDSQETLSGIGFSIVSGLLWALGTALVNYSIAKFDTPIALLAPVYNMNTLVAVLGGMILFAEWKTINSIPVFIGTVLVVCGGILLSKS
ncbi:MAG: GRP family sugar transporter [Xenococcaceae cyanobacterium MO_167.B27]|nr:GRP family sugar transporter [Xenococcaceae cyanobacterium MO_167.B27]